MTLKLIRVRRLKQLQTERGALGPAQLGQLIGKKANQASDLLQGRAPFGEKIARSIEEHAGLPSGWLDELETPPPRSPRRQRILDNAIEVPLLYEQGPNDAASIFLSPLAISRRWIERVAPLIESENLRLLRVSDDGMQPTFGSGDVLLVDIGVNECTRDGVYLLHTPRGSLIRRIRLRIDGSFEISEDSPTARSVELVAESRLKVNARVIWAWVGKSL
jgi:phage repressor protein C with HTH and peptisase S24 domain